MSWTRVTVALMFAAWLLATAFPIRYVLSYPHSWFRSFEGRYLVLSKAAFSVILALGPVLVLFPRLRGWPGWAPVRAGVYVLLCGVFVTLNIMLTRAKRARERDQL